MKAIALQLQRFGAIEEAMKLVEINLPALQANEVLIEMKRAPINPADLNLIEGKYPIEINLPAVIGHEGVGVITEIGREVSDLQVGQYAIVISKPGAWCTHRVVEAAKVIPVPKWVSLEQLSMMTVNPPTAWQMLHQFVDLQPGDWVVQNAANSVVGEWVINICAQLQINTINVVRREELFQPLLDQGATAVITDHPQFSKTIKEKTAEGEVKLALNAVGGESAREIAKALSPGGTHVTYGAMGKQPLEMPNGLLIFKDIKFVGFWLTHWYQKATLDQLLEMFGKLCQIQKTRGFQIPVAQTYGLSEYREALSHAGQSARGGKIIFEM